jgi:hypothetical protein
MCLLLSKWRRAGSSVFLEQVTEHVKGAGRCEEKVEFFGPSRSPAHAWNATKAILEWAAHDGRR